MAKGSPIRVDFVAAEAHGCPGRLGLTIAPGKCDGFTRRDLGEDLHRLRDDYRADVLVSLLEDEEYEWLGIANLWDAARQAGIEVRRLSIRDVSVPDSMSDCCTMVHEAVGAMREGKVVVVHCRGGLGRSGLVAACCLVECGSDAETAVEEVRRARPGAVETREQERFVQRFAENLAGRGNAEE